MSLARYAKRRDANEPEIVEALRKAGCRVVKADVVDLIVQRGESTYLLEVKMPKGKRTKVQKAMEAEGWHIAIVRSAEEALAEVMG